MNSRHIYAVLAATAVAFLGGWLLYGVLLMDFLESHMESYEGLVKDPPEMWAMALAILMQSVLVVFVVHHAGSRSFGSGLKTGVILALLIGVTYNLYMLAMLNLYDAAYMVTDILATMVLLGLSGAVAGLILGRGNQKQAEFA